MSAVIECINISKQYKGGCQALDNVSLNCQSGRIVGLLGPNGSGKTTLIKILEKLLVPTGGTFAVAGQTDPVEIKKIVSYLPDCNFLGDILTVKDALDYFQTFFEDFDRPRAEEMMEKLGITGKQYLKTMSKGTKDKLQLVLVMSRRAKLYLLDEPIGGVDPATRDFILHTIVANTDEDSSVLISTHLISDVEPILDEAVFINNGRIVLKSTVDAIREEHGKSVNDYFREVFKCC